MSGLLKHLSPRRAYLLAVVLMSILGGAIAIYTSANGPWGYQDSASYIITARNLMRGIGLGYYLPNGQFVVWTLKPPLYSAVLSTIGLFGVDLVDASRWLNIFLFTGTIILAGLIFLRYSSDPKLSIPVSLLLVTFPTMVRMFSSSMSEPLFVFFLVASGFCLVSYFRNNTIRWLALSAVSTSLLPMTRYIGIAMIPVGMVSIFVFLPKSWKERLKKAVVYGFTASLPILVWEAWVYFRVDRSFAGRGISFDWSALSGRFIQFYSAVTQYVLSWIPFGGQIWELRFRYRYGLIFLLVAALFVATLLAVKRTHKSIVHSLSDSDLQVFGISALWLGAYLLFLAVDGLFLTPIPPITNRIMLPFYVGMVLGAAGGWACWQNAWFHGGWRWLQVLPWAIALWGAVWYYPQTVNEVILPFHQGIGQTAYYWKNSETMSAVRSLPKNVVVVSNDSYAIWVWADRPAYDLMENIQPPFINRDTPYGTDLSDAAQVAFRKRGTTLVIFSGEFSRQMESVFGEAGRSRLDTLFTGLVVGSKYSDGVIYYYP